MRPVLKLGTHEPAADRGPQRYPPVANGKVFWRATKRVDKADSRLKLRWLLVHSTVNPEIGFLERTTVENRLSSEARQLDDWLQRGGVVVYDESRRGKSRDRTLCKSVRYLRRAECLVATVREWQVRS